MKRIKVVETKDAGNTIEINEGNFINKLDLGDIEIRRKGRLADVAFYLPEVIRGEYVRWELGRDEKNLICLVPVAVNGK